MQASIVQSVERFHEWERFRVEYKNFLKILTTEQLLLHEKLHKLSEFVTIKRKLAKKSYLPTIT